MTSEQKAAIARIISDVIKADNIIEKSEIFQMNRLIEEYSIGEKHLRDSRQLKFSEAVCILQEQVREKSDYKKIEKFINEIYNIIISDNQCVPREALLLIALKYCLINYKPSHNNEYQPYLISCPTNEASTANEQYIVYLENSFDERINNEVVENFRLLVSETRLCGFHFIYIPKMVEEFKQMDKSYIVNVIKYMDPSLSKEFINRVYDKLCGLTTKEFYNSVLKERMQIITNKEIRPSILVNIGTSVVPYCKKDNSIQYYTEFLCIPIDGKVLDTVDSILNNFKSNINVNQTISTIDEGQFKYFGFYKALFDFLIAPPTIKPDLVFCGQLKSDKYKILFRTHDSETFIDLSPKEYAAYLDIAVKTYCTKHKGIKSGQIENRRSFAPIISHIKSKIRNMMYGFSHIESYMPIKTNNIYKLSVEAEKIFIREIVNGKVMETNILKYITNR